MLAITRKNKIREIVQKNKSGTVMELAKLFSVSEETIRRDLKLLEVEGLLVRTYGGAYVQDSVHNEVHVTTREGIFVEGKRAIARRCAELISEGDTIFLDSSTTAYHICEQISERELTVVTNSLLVTNRLCDCAGIELFTTGGSLAKNTMSFVGRGAVKSLSQYHMDKAFVSCDYVSLTHGLTDANEAQADIRQLAIERSKCIYLVADHTKFDNVAFVKICDVSQLNGIVVDRPLPDGWHESLAELHVSLYECPDE